LYINGRFEFTAVEPSLEKWCDLYAVTSRLCKKLASRSDCTWSKRLFQQLCFLDVFCVR
ncbi:hypothetical protein RvY_06668, partial [Ramazzottius varieornatus]